MPWEDLGLNESAADVADSLLEDPELANVEVHDVGGAAVVDCGVHAVGGLLAGRLLAETCMAGLAEVHLQIGNLNGQRLGQITVEMEDPTVACLLSQYAGWKVAVGDYFAMASGPMRAAHGNEPILEALEYSEEADIVVGVLESPRLPDEEVVRYLADCAGVEPEDVILLVARTASIAGCYQVIARSVETCLHKLHELGFDVTRVRSALGTAFLPPVPKDDLVAIGRTNDSILYGGEVLLWIEGSDDAIRELGPKVPSNSSRDYGAPFADIFQRYNHDFYKIDPLLFSPALIVFNNIRSGNSFQFGAVDHTLLERSFYGR